MIGIIDYGMGNLGSVTNACRYLRLPARVVHQPEELDGCAAMILPGVGAFGDCVRNLEQAGFVAPVQAWIRAGRPFLGICLGLQMLYEGSEESPGARGLGIFSGVARRFAAAPDRKVPLIGWNRVRQARPDCPLFDNIADQTYFYFVHSYYVEAQDGTAAGVTDYGVTYAAAVWRDNIMAVQFHPEKSQRAGLRMLANFGTRCGLKGGAG